MPATLPQSGTTILRGILRLRGWNVRKPQYHLVQGLTQARKQPQPLSAAIVDAPVGTGKTLGYLTALAPYGRTVIATSTKALQDQIIGSEIPEFNRDMTKLYGEGFTYSVLKGKNNYLSFSAVDSWIEEHPLDHKMAHKLGAMKVAALEQLKATSDTFDQEAELGTLPLFIRQQVDSSSANSPQLFSFGKELSFLEQIQEELDNPTEPYRYAIARAYMADIIVTNISLLGTETVSGKRYSPFHGVTNIILDEAHHAEDIIMGAQAVTYPLDDIKEFIEKHPCKTANLFPQMIATHTAKHDRDSTYALCRSTKNMVDTIYNDIPDLSPSDKSKYSKLCHGLDDCLHAVSGEQTLVTEKGDKKVPTHYLHIDSKEKTDITLYPMNTGDFHEQLHRLCGQPSDLDLFSAPDEDAQVELDRTLTVLCSGTITKRYAMKLGVTGLYIKVPSPFDSKRVRYFLAQGSDYDPGSNGDVFKRASIAAALSLIKASGGRALVLTTSFTRIHDYVTAITQNFPGLTVLSQTSQLSREETIEKFVEDETSILVGTKSFWEGIDIPGSALTLVIIDKIPFPIYGDPIVKAQALWYDMQHKGKSPSFTGIYVPHASRMISQGMGRLIRSVNDYGTIAILDSRVTGNGYGKVVLQLEKPDILATMNLGNACEWTAQVNNGVAPETISRNGFGPLRRLIKAIPVKR